MPTMSFAEAVDYAIEVLKEHFGTFEHEKAQRAITALRNVGSPKAGPLEELKQLKAELQRGHMLDGRFAWVTKRVAELEAWKAEEDKWQQWVDYFAARKRGEHPRQPQD